ncbi:DUF6089 family protein [Salegentibacter sp. F188]|uniref:DUF6089 family protein n=1 Tax=Autumnicola patrickiae TaxID=3075591 RepID=A0ABU3E042_9FLAO|nr:DUF6089 family protein [Salegentibacter sp. F188]MDT0689325.1 DUF6089 family protein [Salegentibacter sp. F188]
MKHLLAFAFLVICTTFSHSQTFEIGPFIGGANYIGDVGKSNFINPNTLVGGAIAKWNRSPRHAFRASLLYGEIAADDANSSEIRRQQRGYSFSNTIAEASLGIEFNFWNYDLHEGIPQSTPYLYTGLTFFRADHVYLQNGRGGNLENEGTNWEFSIPMVLGYKETITQNIIGGLEVGARYTFSDNLDGSWPSELLGRRDPPIEFGNRNTSDWYVFTGITLTFTFGRKPCYSHF